MESNFLIFFIFYTAMNNNEEQNKCHSAGCVSLPTTDSETERGLVYVISSSSMGRGNDELGWALLQTYIQTIHKVRPLPTKILLYNGGVRLAAEESGALNALRQLQEQGVEILACGTCLDFFGLISKIKVGRISNMLEIMNTICGAAKTVSPF
jgi:selenium metabolism protein YedF